MSLILNLLPSIISGAENPLSTISAAVGITSSFDTGGNSDIDTTAELLTSDTGTTFTCTQGVIITAAEDNSGLVYIGNSDVTAAAANNTTGIPIAAGESLFFSCSGPEKVYVVGSAVNQACFWLAV